MHMSINLPSREENSQAALEGPGIRHARKTLFLK